MADEWIKMRVSLLTDHRVVRLAELLGADDPDLVVGKLFRLWVHADQHTTDGTMFTATMRTVDNLLGYPGFAAALQRIGWLETRPECVVIPRFAEHNGESAKRRCQERRRKKNQRNRQSERDILRTKVGHDAPQEERKEKREERTENSSSPPHAAAPPSLEEVGEVSPTPPLVGVPPTAKGPSAKEFLEAWNAVPGFQPARRMSPDRVKALRARCADPDWVAHWREALALAGRRPFCTGQNDRGWRGNVQWFLRPETVNKILEGQYQGGPAGRKSAESPAEKIARIRKEDECRRNGTAGPPGTSASSG